jgi:hypothetical protein
MNKEHPVFVAWKVVAGQAAAKAVTWRKIASAVAAHRLLAS